MSGINSLLEPLSRYCDFFLNPLVQQTPSYIKDTKHLLQVINNTEFNPETQLLVGLDIESLYTSIPQDATIQVLRQVLMESPWPHRTPRDFILQCATIALKENYFEYEGSLYLQTNGTSMGSVFAPSVAGLYVHLFEQTHITHNTNPYTGNILTWRRYIDDILMIWQGSEITLQLFLTWLNERDPYLKFTSTSSASHLAFLDLNIWAKDGQLITTTYYKPTSRNSLLHYTSFHPRPLRENLPFGQFLRIRRNCTQATDYKNQSADLSKKLEERGYPRAIINKTKKRARNQNREALLETVPKDKSDQPITCVTTFNTASNEVAKLIRRNWKILNSGQRQWETPRFAYKRCNNLKDQLVSTRPRPLTNREPNTILNAWGLPKISGHYPCNDCSVCHLTSHTKTLILEPDKVWTQRSHTNCNSRNVIYLLTCRCGLRYIGMTARKIRTRVTEHRSTIRCKKNISKLTSHFITQGHTPNDLTWTIIEQLPELAVDNEKKLLSKEQRWIYRLSTQTNGLNDAIPWNSVTP